MSSMSTASRVQLLCKHGHLVTKCKKLKPWQGHLNARVCNSCGHPIDRHELRWRCQEHCDWDLCRGCYDRHWSNVIHKAKKTVDSGKRHELLQAIPEERRPREQEFEVGLPHADHAAVSEDEALGWSTWLLQVLVLAIVWVISTYTLTQGTAALLGGKEPLMPDTWMVSGFVHGGAIVVCRLAALALQYDSKGDDEAVEATSAGVLGLMYGIECGLHFYISKTEDNISDHGSYLLQPVALTLAGLLSGTEQAQVLLVLPPLLATAGSVLVAPSIPTFHSILGASPALLASNLLTVFRWTFVLNVLPRVGGMGPLVFLAYQMMLASSALGFELAFMTDYSSYFQLLKAPAPLKAATILAILAVAAGAQIAAEFRFVRLTSLTTLGLLSPLLNVVSTSLAFVRGDTRLAWLPTCIGLLMCVAAMLVHQASHGKLQSSTQVSPQEDYQKMSDNMSHMSAAAQRYAQPAHPRGAQDYNHASQGKRSFASDAGHNGSRRVASDSV